MRLLSSLVAALLVLGCAPVVAVLPTVAPGEFGPTGPMQTATVVRVVDGDTIIVELDGREQRVRYIGMDAPESVRPDFPVEFMGRAASAANEALVGGQSVVLERDVSETDRFGRLLRYVWLPGESGWQMVNLELVERGFANAVSYPPDVHYQDLLRAAERDARDAGRGLWGAP